MTLTVSPPFSPLTRPRISSIADSNLVESPVARIGSENSAALPFSENTGFCGGSAIGGRSSTNDC